MIQKKERLGVGAGAIGEMEKLEFPKLRIALPGNRIRVGPAGMAKTGVNAVRISVGGRLLHLRRLISNLDRILKLYNYIEFLKSLHFDPRKNWEKILNSNIHSIFLN